MDAYCKSLGKTTCFSELSSATLLPYARYKRDSVAYYCYEDVNTDKTGENCRAPGVNGVSRMSQCFEGSGARCDEGSKLLNLAIAAAKKGCSGNFLLTLHKLKSIIRFD